MNEIWADVSGYEGIYQVSNLGNVRSLDRFRKNRKGLAFIKGRMLAQQKQKNGYLSVNFTVDGVVKNVRVHRLVASAFIDNPNGFNEVNHIDENKENNCCDNLEWCTRSYNCSYGKGLSKRAAKCSIPCIQLRNGIEIARYPSIIEASRQTGINMANIQRCISGDYSQTHGFQWKRA